MFQSLHDLHGTVLDSFQHVHVCVVEGSLEVDVALQVCLTSADQRKRITSLSLLSAALPSAAQGAVASLCCRGVLLTVLI